MKNRAVCATLVATLLSAAPSSAQPTAPPPVPKVPASAPAPEDPTAKARERFTEGVALVKKKEWAAAYGAFLVAWKLKQHPQIALNLGHVEMQIGKYREAITHLQHWLDNNPPEDPDSVLARQWLSEAKKKVVTLKIKVNGAGAEVQIDGQTVGTSPLPPEVYVDPGKHTVIARRGALRDEVTGTYEAGWTRVIPLVPIEPGAPPLGAPTTAPEAAEKPFPVRTVALAAGGATALTGLAVGIAGMALASAKAGERDAFCAQSADQCLTPRSEDPALYDSQKAVWTRLDSERLSNWNMGITGFVIGGIAAVGTGAAFLLWKPSASAPGPLQGVTIIPAGAGALLKATW